MYSEFGFSCYRNIMNTRYDNISEIGETILVPKLTPDVIFGIIDETLKTLQKDTPLLVLSGRFCIVGDLHGNFFDLIRIFARNGYPPITNYIFLGDYVDRGDMSLETITLLFILKVCYPKNIFLLRGNHEFRAINKAYGFFNQIDDFYKSSDLWERFNQAFEYLPIACTINKQIFCVHGGLSNRLCKVNQINNLSFPIDGSDLVTDLLWSDPTKYTATYNVNQRGNGCTFGALAVSHFLSDNNLKMMIRAHECVNGYRYSFQNSLLTLFSSSKYTNMQNEAGYALIDDNSSVFCFQLEPFSRPYAKDIVFYDAIREDVRRTYLSNAKVNSREKFTLIYPRQKKIIRKISYSSLPNFTKL